MKLSIQLVPREGKQVWVLEECMWQGTVGGWREERACVEAKHEPKESWLYLKYWTTIRPVIKWILDMALVMYCGRGWPTGVCVIMSQLCLEELFYSCLINRAIHTGKPNGCESSKMMILTLWQEMDDFQGIQQHPSLKGHSSPLQLWIIII